MNHKVLCLPVPKKLSIWRRLRRWLPGFCGYCGLRYKLCNDMRHNGMCCPLGHEGYIDIHTMFGTMRQRFDFVKYPPDVTIN